MKILYVMAGLMCCSALAQQPAFKLSGELELGMRYDSKLNVSELDSHLATDDQALVSTGKIKARWQADEKWHFTSGISHSLTRYDSHQDFNLDITTLSVSGGFNSALAQFGLHAYQAGAQLGGDDFLTYQQQGLSVADHAFGQGFWRISLDQTDKSFAQLSHRDASAHSIRGDGFWFYQQDGFINLSYEFQDEDAHTRALDFISHGVNLKLQHSLALLGETTRLQASYQFERRRYGTDEQSGAGRDDHRSVLQLSVHYPLLPYLDVNLSAQRGDYDSTLATADFHETLAELSVRAHF